MFDVPGFNPHAMSDEELLNKQVELNRRLSWAARFSGSGMGDQLLLMIQSIEAERRDRILRVMFTEREKLFPKIIETEPDLAEKNKRETAGEIETDDSMVQRRRMARERLTMKKTAKPTKAPQTVFPNYHEEKIAKTTEPSEDKGNE